MNNIIFSNRDKFERIRKEFKEEGLSKIHILADFDKTLTKASVDGKDIPSIISILRNGNYLRSGYAKKAHHLYNKYNPLENDKRITKKEKKEIMHKWWTEHFNLLIKSGLKKKDIITVAGSKEIRFRDNFSEMLEFLRDKKIPLVIISSAGLGKDSILEKLKKERKLYDNIYVISNEIEWDEKGLAIAFKEPIVHGANKDETLIKDFPQIFEKIKDRKNIILLGDSLSDVGMAEGSDYSNLLKVAFLNEKTEKKKDIYRELYDVLILKDSSLEFVSSFLKDVAKR